MEPEVWALIWIAVTVAFTVGELLTPGAFFMAPFAAGGAVAALASFLGAPVAIGWLLFIATSLAAFAALRPLARRLDAAGGNPGGVGASRLVGETAIVVEPIPAGPSSTGMVRVGREQWRAETTDGSALGAGAVATVVEVRGTRVLVAAADRRIPSSPPVN